MKRYFSVLLVLVLMLNMTALTSSAAESTDPDLVDRFVENVFDLEHKEQFTLLLSLIRIVEDREGLLDAYERGFYGLTGGQQERIENFGVSLDAMNAFVDYIMSETFDEAVLYDYLGLDGSTEDPELFRAATERRETEFRSAMESAGADISALDNGFSRMDTLFGFLEDSAIGNLVGLSIPFLMADEAYLTDGHDDGSQDDYYYFEVDPVEADKVVIVANEKLEDDIEYKDTVISAIGDFTDFYNGASYNDRSNIFAYLSYFGFVRVYEEASNNVNTGSGSVYIPDTVITQIEELIPDDPIALAAPFLQERKVIAAEGGILTFEDTSVEMSIPVGTFDEEVTMSVDVFNEMDIELAGAITTGYEDSDEVLTLQGDVYKFETTGINSFEKGIVVSIPVSLPDGFTDFHTLGIYQYDEVIGEWIFVGGTYDASTGRITVTLEHFSYYAILTYYKDFDDIADNWAVDYIRYLAAKRVINGRTETSYEPNSSLTRAEFTKLLIYGAGLKLDVSELSFDDVSLGEWYGPSIAKAEAIGIIDGGTENSFRPNSAITREEMVDMIMKLYGYMTSIDYSAVYGDTIMMFSDGDDASDWAITSIKGANELNIVNGVGYGRFDPKGTAKRSEAAKIIKLLLDTF